MVGRSNQENDEITFRVSAPGDWWFHAEGVPGSHVVLRPRGGTDAPPARIIEQAASVAAHYSKARHSGLVPVIYTLRKYVRKFRGAEPGQVKCERETMVMVPPVLPGEAPEES
jgi:predicted ribosome quality control (RQC) complex YloA/Tae2 family protein